VGIVRDNSDRAAQRQCGSDHQNMFNGIKGGNMAGMNAAQHLAVNQIKNTETGHATGRRAFMLCFVMHRRRIGIDRHTMFMQNAMRQRMGQCPMLRDEQQPRQHCVQPARAQCPSQQCSKSHALFADGNRIGQPVIQPHRIITQDGETPGHDDRLEAVFNRCFGLDFDHLLGASGHAERAGRR